MSEEYPLGITYGHSAKNEEEICEKLQQVLKPRRYRHTLQVAETAVLLARHYHISEEKARLAGLLHDCGKEAGTALTHAAISAQLAQSEYHVQDPEILSAIACHTTGKPAMSILDKILFVADYIEPGRDRTPHLDYLRKEAYQNLDNTIICVLSDTLSYLKQAGVTIDESSVDTYNYYQAKCKKSREYPWGITDGHLANSREGADNGRIKEDD